MPKESHHSLSPGRLWAQIRQLDGMRGQKGLSETQAAHRDAPPRGPSAQRRKGRCEGLLGAEHGAHRVAEPHAATLGACRAPGHTECLGDRPASEPRSVRLQNAPS